MKQNDIGEISKLLEIMSRLRDPEHGCPWDLEQRFESIAPYTIEEAYEVADAIERGALTELEDELGDLLLQVVFHSQMAKEAGAFTFAGVTRRICDKMVRRHPHVFGGAPRAGDGHQDAWDALKHQERRSRASADEGLLDGVPVNLPSLTRAVKLGRRASRVGFDWPDARGPREKVTEELGELDDAIAGADPDRIRAELGDVFFALANLARHLEVDPEQCARGANARFQSRFADVEAQIRESGRGFDAHSMEELERYWLVAKARERNPSD